jgi:hypothetical protein
VPKKDAPLSRQEVAQIRGWIEQVAHWPAGLVLKNHRFEGQRCWLFEPLKRPASPAVKVKTPGWPRTPIDVFIQAKLDREGLTPSSEADRRTLIRRLSYEHLVDRLLGSPHYGERWGRHWLNVVHYRDTHGYDKVKRRDHAWPYRDYVIQSFNDDLPYSHFIREQVAGDVLEPGDPRGVIATGFIAAGPWDFVGHAELREGTVDKLKAQVIDRDDMPSNTMSTFVDLFMVRQSQELARRVEQQESDPARRIDAACLRALGRLPTAAERAALAAHAARHGLALACRVLFNTNEFIFVD